MKIALLQSDLVWENPEANRNNFSNSINDLEGKIDLIVLPEMFATGFTMNPAPVAEKMHGETVMWMQKIAQTQNSAIMGSLIIAEYGNFYNRLLFVHPTGEIQSYDKRHLFSLAGEDKSYTAGREKLIIEYNGWKICPLVCYDLRFPVFSRNTEDYDLLIYVANWPQQRIDAWDTLLKARAIENMSYAIGVNRVGEDENGHAYSGHSQIIDPLGSLVIKPTESEGAFVADLDLENVREQRRKFAFLEDRDDFKVLD